MWPIRARGPAGSPWRGLPLPLLGRCLAAQLAPPPPRGPPGSTQLAPARSGSAAQPRSPRATRVAVTPPPLPGGGPHLSAPPQKLPPCSPPLPRTHVLSLSSLLQDVVRLHHLRPSRGEPRSPLLPPSSPPSFPARRPFPRVAFLPRLGSPSLRDAPARSPPFPMARLRRGVRRVLPHPKSPSAWPSSPWRGSFALAPAMAPVQLGPARPLSLSVQPRPAGPGALAQRGLAKARRGPGPCPTRCARGLPRSRRGHMAPDSRGPARSPPDPSLVACGLGLPVARSACPPPVRSRRARRSRPRSRPVPARPWRPGPARRGRHQRGPATCAACSAPGMVPLPARRPRCGPPCTRRPTRLVVPTRRGRGALASSPPRRGPASVARPGHGGSTTTRHPHPARPRCRLATRRARGTAPARLVRGASVRPCAL
jgi:hypothetical protein